MYTNAVILALATSASLVSAHGEMGVAISQGSATTLYKLQQSAGDMRGNHLQ